MQKKAILRIKISEAFEQNLDYISLQALTAGAHRNLSHLAEISLQRRVVNLLDRWMHFSYVWSFD